MKFLIPLTNSHQGNSSYNTTLSHSWAITVHDYGGTKRVHEHFEYRQLGWPKPLTNQQDYIELADTLGINYRSTARSIVATYVDTGRVQKLPRGGARNVKMDGDMRNHLENIIDGNPLLTLRQMKESLQHNLPDKPVVSISSVARAVDGTL